jgi:hypothetical protein
LVGAQLNFTANPKYGKMKHIKGGIPSIILSNPDEDWIAQLSSEQYVYFTNNCKIHFMGVEEKFFQ